MLYLKRTVLPIAIFRLVSASYPMTGIAIMCITVAEPKRNGAAPFTLKVDVFSPVLVAIGDPSADQSRGTFCAYKVFFAILAGCRHFIAAVIHATEVGTLTLETHVVGALEHSIGLQIIEEAICRV